MLGFIFGLIIGASSGTVIAAVLVTAGRESRSDGKTKKKEGSL